MPHKLLLADDSVTIQRVIELTFADEDVQVIAVGDGKQAIQRAQQDRPDIVLADVGMPERDGYEVAAFIKSTPELKHIPVLLLTGAFEPIDEGRARAVGCDGVLVKPFEPQLVINRVKDLISGRRAPAEPQPEPRAQEAAGPAPVPVQTPASGSTPPAGSPGSIEDYFDRLDAAFSSLDGGGVAAPPAPTGRGAMEARGLTDEFPAWTPTRLGDPLGTAAAPAPSAMPGSAVQVPRPIPPAPAPPPPSLAEAFAALLAAEQGRPYSPAAPQPVQVDEKIIEEITRRVIDRVSDRAVREVVLEVAERLVREEIDRIKSHAR